MVLWQGYPRGYRRGGHSPSGPSTRLLGNDAPTSRVQREAFDARIAFFTSIPPRFQDHVDEVELTVHRERTMTTGQEVVDSTIRWILDVGTTWARETRYWKTVELYWHIKNLLGQMLQIREEAQNTMQLQLDGLHLMMREVLSRLPLSSTMVTALAPRSTANSASEQTQDRSVMQPGHWAINSFYVFYELSKRIKARNQ